MKSTLKVALGLLGVVTVAGIIAGVVLLTRNKDTEEGVPTPELAELDWWQHCVLYQIYPRSFKDSDGDGIGDLRGIISELEHFVDAGVDAIWVSPIFTSPMVDFGYDISNFYDIHYEYGTMQDFQELVQRAHDLGIKVLLDFVPNHASTESEYFRDSEARVPGFEDYFIWADGYPDPVNDTNRLPPSNWVSVFGGSAWEWSDIRQQFYLHQFAVEQADFNFRSQAVKDELINIMRFWMDLGADGFRLDALPYLIEADPADHEGRYPDEPLSGLTHLQPNQPGYTLTIYTKDKIELYDIIYEWRDFVDEYLEEKGGDTRVLFGEGYANASMTMLYYNNEDGSKTGVHFPFNFDFVTDVSAESDARDFVYTILKWMTYMPRGGVANWVVSVFGGSAWEWSDIRQQFYLHQFAVEQADFNFRSQAVKDELINIMRFWMDLGADGFRLDALPYLIEADPADHEGRYPDEPLSGLTHLQPNQPGYTLTIYTKDKIELYDIIYEWRDFVDEYLEEKGGDTRVLFGEGYANASMTMLYYNNEDGSKTGVHFPFNFDFVTDVSAESDARDFVYTILKWMTYMPRGGVANWVFGNHDNRRMATRFREDLVDGLNALDMMLPGVAVTYQGDELGMRDGYVSWEDTVDVLACNQANETNYYLHSRDPARTPYHWDNSTSAGFSSSPNTWLPVAEDYLELNLARQKEDERSHYKVYQSLTALRREKTLSHGDFQVLALTQYSLAVVRRLQAHCTLALLLNVGQQSDVIQLDWVPGLALPAAVQVSSVHSTWLPGEEITEDILTLIPGEALILRAPLSCSSSS